MGYKRKQSRVTPEIMYVYEGSVGTEPVAGLVASKPRQASCLCSHRVRAADTDSFHPLSHLSQTPEAFNIKQFGKYSLSGNSKSLICNAASDSRLGGNSKGVFSQGMEFSTKDLD